MIDIPVKIIREGIKPPEDINVNVTDSATEQIIKLTDAIDDNVILRIAISAGGCAGFQMKMSFEPFNWTTGAPDNEDDYLQYIGGKGAHAFIIDRLEMSQIDGSTIDYTTSGLNSQFIITTPNTATCGCGLSFG